MTRARTKRSVITIVLSVILVTGLALFLANAISQSSELQSLIASLGYFGVFIVAVIGGLNVLIPIPAVTFTPMFTASGLSLPLIIITLTVGTLVADYIGYVFGTASRPLLYSQYPTVITWLEQKIITKPKLLFPFTLLFAAVFPLPNEVLIIPAAVIGISFKRLIIPLTLGNLINLTAYGVGIQTLFDWMF